jgi:hypothetical protein
MRQGNAPQLLIIEPESMALMIRLADLRMAIAQPECVQLKFSVWRLLPHPPSFDKERETFNRPRHAA